jgi:aminopeptidase N
MRQCIIVSVVVCGVMWWGMSGLMAHPHPERIGLPPSTISASELDDRFSHDDSLHIYDTRHYELRVDFDLVNEIIYGDGTILCYSTNDSLDEILLELKSLTVDTVMVNGVMTTFDYHSDSLFVPLSGPLPEGDSVTVRVVYHGHPVRENWGGFWFQNQVTFTLGDGLYVYPPPYNHTWFPNWRHPADKFTMEMWFTVPEGKVAASNSEFIESIPHIPEQTVTWHWRQNEPISSYLYCVAISNYIVLEDSVYDWIEHYIYPSYLPQAQVSFANVHLMMEAYEDLFRPYPFTGKFGYAMVGQGDMEHVGLVAHVYWAVNGGHGYDWLLAHEMSHMWWGDMVTCGTWKDLWLNEGFATYCEALFHEHAYGVESYRNYVQSSLMSPYFSSGQYYPIYDPLQLWSYTVYEKGACVMHMLRHVLGDSLFFAGWNEYGERYYFDTAVTEEFQEVMEEISGEDLDWFFEEWIYGPGYPIYEYAWQGVPSGNDWDVQLWVDQTQTMAGTFTMPIDIAVISAVDTVVRTVWIDEDPDEVTFAAGGDEPVEVIFDYHNWMLEVHSEIPWAVDEESVVPVEFSLQPTYPNPFNSSTVIRYSVPRVCRTEMAVFNVLGQKVATLVDGEVRAGEHRIRWDGRDANGIDVASGVYMIGMRAPGFQRVQKVILLR